MIGVFIVGFGFVFTTTAFLDHSHDHYMSLAPRPPVPQFQSWYPKHNRKLIEITHTKCNASYLLTTCYSLEGCLLDAVPADWPSNYNSANIILGLTPTLLASIGPSFAEISLLSAHRPLLSFLISMGATAIWPNRIFEYIHPPEILRQRRKCSIRASKLCHWPAAMMSLGQYIIAIGAMTNVMTTSIELGRKSILTFGCTTTFAPLLWSTLPSAIHLISVLSYFIARKVAQQRQGRATEQSSEAGNSETQVISEHTQAETSHKVQGRFHKVLLAWSSEITICANHPKFHGFQDETVPRISILLAVAAGLMNFCHVTFGIIIFSSLQLVSVEDAFKKVLWRYIVSSTACRLLLIVEMSGLRANIEVDSDTHTSQEK